LLYHPHVHLIVTAGGLSADGTRWMAARNPAFLVPVQALSVIVRAKMCAALQRAGVLDQVPRAVWTTAWVVHAQPAGTGQRVLDYLARYLFRVAICNSRIDRIDDDQVTFRYRDNRTQEIRLATLAGVEFLRRFVQHVLPRRFTKVRYFGLWSRARRRDLDHAQQVLQRSATTPPPATVAPSGPLPVVLACPLCHKGTLVLIAVLRRQPHLPP
jgi:hypothetical protein